MKLNEWEIGAKRVSEQRFVLKLLIWEIGAKRVSKPRFIFEVNKKKIQFVNRNLKLVN